MALTRSSTSLRKSQIKLLSTMCKGLIDGTNEEGFFGDPAACAAAFVKLDQARKRLLLTRGDELPTTNEDTEEFLKVEELDQHCLTTLEELLQSLPPDHTLRKTSSHLRDAGAGDATSAQSGNRSKKPLLPDFDGKNSSWIWWKIIFEREVLFNTDLSSEHKYSYLISSIKRKTVASKIVLNYAGVSDAFELSWRDLKDQFSSASDLKSSHLQGLRDLNQKYSVTRSDDVRRLEDLYHAAWGHVNALKALCAEKAIYQPLTIISLRESLPSILREDFLRKHDADDLGETAFDDLFVFLKEEIRVRRGSWQLGRHRNERSVPVAKPRESEKSFHPSRTEERPKDRKKYRTGNRESGKGSSKHSSMLQDAQLVEDSEDLN